MGCWFVGLVLKKNSSEASSLHWSDGAVLGRLVKSMLGDNEVSVAGSLLGDADGIIDSVSFGANVNTGDGTSVATVDGAALATLYPEHMQHASATVLPKLSYFLSEINASHHKVSLPM